MVVVSVLCWVWLVIVVMVICVGVFNVVGVVGGVD